MSKLKHVEGIGLIDLSAVTLVSELDEDYAFYIATDHWEQIFQGSATRDNLIKAIEEHDKFFYGSIE